MRSFVTLINHILEDRRKINLQKSQKRDVGAPHATMTYKVRHSNREKKKAYWPVVTN